jgi:signal-transduction protein with cAMP-binding, CBS, and nucleotidyltransferase domain
MQHGAVVELLARTPMFRGLGGELLTAIVQRGHLLRFGAGQMLAIAGEPADKSFFILEGKANFLDPEGNELDLELRSINDMAMFVETNHFYGALAVDEVMVFSLPRDAMCSLMLEQPYLAGHFARSIKQNLAVTAESLRELDDMLDKSAPEISKMDEPPLANEVAIEAPGVIAFDEINAASEGMENGQRQAVQNSAMNGPAGNLPVNNLLADLNAARENSDQIPPEQAHDQMAFPSHAPRQSPEVRPKTFSELVSPRYDQAVAHG